MLLGTGAFATVDTYLVSLGTPPASQLAGYHAVLVYAKEQGLKILDPVLLGDRLAAYHDQGGGVVVTSSALINYESRALKGAYGDPGNGYSLFNYSSGREVYRGQDTIGAVLEPQSPLMYGVVSFTSPDHILGTGSVINGGVVVARYLGGGQEPLVVRGTRGDRTLVELNFDPVSSSGWPGGWQGDGAKLIRNALKYSRCMRNGTGISSTAGVAQQRGKALSTSIMCTTAIPPVLSMQGTGEVRPRAAQLR
jgi:hypothetical protein